jgi:hypothetical protein
MNKQLKGKARPKTSRPAARSQPPKSKAKGKPKKNYVHKGTTSRPSFQTRIPGGPITRQYLKTLIDPFEFAGVPLGFGTLVPTRISTIYLRGSTTADSTGYLALGVYPQAHYPLQLANSGASASFTTSAAPITSIDEAAITANLGSARVVSVGIKAYPNLAATSTPGLVVSGAIPGSTPNLFGALTPTDLISFPTSHVGKGYEGAVACSRPQDTVSFEFYQQMVNNAGFATTTDFPCSIPYICFSGIGNGTVVYYEVAINIEGIEILQHSSAAMGMSIDNTRTLASEWDSLEHMWSSVKVILPDPGRIGYDVLSGTGTTTPGIMDRGGSLDYGGQLRANRRS